MGGDGDHRRQHRVDQLTFPCVGCNLQRGQIVLVPLRLQGAFGCLFSNGKAALFKLFKEGQQCGAGLAVQQHRGGALGGSILELTHGLRDRDELLIGAQALEVSEIQVQRLEGLGRPLAVFVLGEQRLAELVAGAGDVGQVGVAEFRDFAQAAECFDGDAGLHAQVVELDLGLDRSINDMDECASTGDPAEREERRLRQANDSCDVAHRVAHDLLHLRHVGRDPRHVGAQFDLYLAGSLHGASSVAFTRDVDAVLLDQTSPDVLRERDDGRVRGGIERRQHERVRFGAGVAHCLARDAGKEQAPVMLWLNPVRLRAVLDEAGVERLAARADGGLDGAAAR